MPRSPQVVCLSLLLSLACKRSGPVAPAVPASPPPPALPGAITGFQAGPEETEGSTVRRRYTRGDTAITVSLARVRMDDNQWPAWAKAAGALPPAALDVPDERGHGFYQCDQARHCDLIVQLRSGAHLELRGGGTATRDDVNAVARELPIPALARDPEGPRPPLVSFRRNVAPVLARHCASSDGCHGADPSNRVHLDLRGPASYRSLLGHPSELRANAVLVTPGQPAASFVVDKLTHHLAPKGEGRPMPLDPQSGSVLEPNPVETFVWPTLVAWIAQGALDE
jgi:hypothetical protein